MLGDELRWPGSGGEPLPTDEGTANWGRPPGVKDEHLVTATDIAPPVEAAHPKMLSMLSSALPPWSSDDGAMGGVRTRSFPWRLRAPRRESEEVMAPLRSVLRLWARKPFVRVFLGFRSFRRRAISVQKAMWNLLLRWRSKIALVDAYWAEVERERRWFARNAVLRRGSTSRRLSVSGRQSSSMPRRDSSLSRRGSDMGSRQGSRRGSRVASRRGSVAGMELASPRRRASLALGMGSTCAAAFLSRQQSLAEAVASEDTYPYSLFSEGVINATLRKILSDRVRAFVLQMRAWMKERKRQLSSMAKQKAAVRSLAARNSRRLHNQRIADIADANRAAYAKLREFDFGKPVLVFKPEDPHVNELIAVAKAMEASAAPSVCSPALSPRPMISPRSGEADAGERELTDEAGTRQGGEEGRPDGEEKEEETFENIPSPPVQQLLQVPLERWVPARAGKVPDVGNTTICAAALADESSPKAAHRPVQPPQQHQRQRQRQRQRQQRSVIRAGCGDTTNLAATAPLPRLDFKRLEGLWLDSRQARMARAVSSTRLPSVSPPSRPKSSRRVGLFSLTV